VLDESQASDVKALLERVGREQIASHADDPGPEDTPASRLPPRKEIDYEALPRQEQYCNEGPSAVTAPSDSKGVAAPAKMVTGGRDAETKRSGSATADKTSKGRLAPEIIQRTIRANYSKFRACYETALGANPDLGGRVQIRFIIAEDGTVQNAAPQCGTTLSDAGAIACIVDGFGKLQFPKPDGGIVTVVYPIMFTPAD
ncbi:MAG: AgmX/PglI C-terminal domain-containing protein, partial [Polyangiaceae bacterium]